MSDPLLQKILAHFEGADETDICRRYLERGRRWEFATTDEVSDAWVDAWRKFLVAPTDQSTVIAEEDAHGELLLRGLKVPSQRVTDETCAVVEMRGRPGDGPSTKH